MSRKRELVYVALSLATSKHHQPSYARKLRMLNTLINLASRAYTLNKLFLLAADPHRYSSYDRAQALTTAPAEFEELLVKITQVPGSSINPAAQSARNASRAQTPVIRAMNTALLGADGTDALAVGGHTLRENENGDLVVVAPDGTETPLALDHSRATKPQQRNDNSQR